MQIADRFKACIIGGAIGDAWGSAWEFDNLKDDKTTWYWGKKPEPDRSWKLTDDTQLTLATCEILGMYRKIEPAVLAAHFLLYYKQGRLSGLGASTLKALKDLEAGIPGFAFVKASNLTRIPLNAKYHLICLNFVTSPHGKQGNTRRILPA
ncbi:MAG: hypothetical protein H6Q26_1047 [Bacteroidetes bacterium]|nr:hypothetical protein [Bacteroidota bacterium]